MADLKEKLCFPVFEIIGQAGDELGLDTYVVGGFVRDSIMGRECKDIDIVTIGSGIELAKKVQEKLFHLQIYLKIWKKARN